MKLEKPTAAAARISVEISDEETNFSQFSSVEEIENQNGDQTARSLGHILRQIEPTEKIKQVVPPLLLQPVVNNEEKPEDICILSCVSILD